MPPPTKIKWLKSDQTNYTEKSALKKNATIAFAVIWLLLATILFCLPGTEFPKFTWQDKIWLDKWIHIFLFMILIILWSKAYSHKKNIQVTHRKIFFRIMIIGIVYGIAVEIVQKYFIPFRSFDLVDILADGIGCIAGYFLSVKKFL